MPPGEKRVAVTVWDLPVRVFHWLLALLFVAQVVTGRIGGDLMPLHILAGEAILALIVFRVLWGFAGSTHARFASFVAGPAATLRFARRLLSRRAVPQLGYNPLGGYGVLVMIGCFALQAMTGLFASGGASRPGALAALVTPDVSTLMTAVHHWNPRVLVAISVLHVAVVLFRALAKRKSFAAMFTGVEEVPPERVRERREVARGTPLRRIASRENSAASTASLKRAVILFVVALAMVVAVTRLPDYLEPAADALPREAR